ncbi:hypothetical protein BD311DRAFT_665337, partial [Dichomitus squalens]
EKGKNVAEDGHEITLLFTEEGAIEMEKEREEWCGKCKCAMLVHVPKNSSAHPPNTSSRPTHPHPPPHPKPLESGVKWEIWHNWGWRA